jgi:chromosome segregation ATPase
MSDDLRRRVAAVERAVTDGETELADVSDAATLDAQLDDAERRLDELSARLRTLDATTQALRGYLGGVDDVDGQANETSPGWATPSGPGACCS